jgi:SAM-dependent methyltransferase
MFVLYGKEYFRRFETIAFFINNYSSIVELCCGFGDFYVYALKKKQIDYLGVDLSQDFVKYGLEKGINIIERDVNSFDFPPSDYYIMISSLYHFYPSPEVIIKRMLSATAKNVVIVEPIKNLLNSKYRIISWLASLLTNEGSGKNNFRFTEESLDKLMKTHFKINIVNVKKTKNGKEKIFILKNCGQN